MKLNPKMGVAFTSIEGFDLDQDKLIAYKNESERELKKYNTNNLVLDFIVNNDETAKKANGIFSKEEIDIVLLVVAIWTPDSVALSIIDDLNVPVILSTNSLSKQTTGINGAQIIAAALEELKIDFKFIFGKLKYNRIRKKIFNYTMAAAVIKKLKKTRIGSIGNIPEIMLSLSTDPFSIKNIFGCKIIPIDYFKLDYYRNKVKQNEIEKRIRKIKEEVGKIGVNDSDLEESISYYYALKRMAEDLDLDVMAFNCFPFPALKGKTCLAVSNLNDDGIVTSCEGDINSSIIMAVFNFIHGHAILNSDIIVEDENNNSIMFSHCGAGPFTCASSKKDIMLLEQYEVKSGVGVYYPVKKNGEDVTIVNLTGRESTYRMCVLSGKSVAIKKREGFIMVFSGNNYPMVGKYYRHGLITLFKFFKIIKYNICFFIGKHLHFFRGRRYFFNIMGFSNICCRPDLNACCY